MYILYYMYMYIPSLNIMTQSLACYDKILKPDWLNAIQLMQR